VILKSYTIVFRIDAEGKSDEDIDEETKQIPTAEDIHEWLRGFRNLNTINIRVSDSSGFDVVESP